MNPVDFVDPDGMDYYMFDSNGKYQQKIQAEGTHRILIHSTGTLESGEEYDQYALVDFADPESDPEAIDNGKINQLVFVSEEEIISIMESQGAFDTDMIDFINESQGGGRFDYSYSALKDLYGVTYLSGGIIQSETLFLPEGDFTAHNLMNFGNYLWGATGYVVGMSYFTLQGGAQINSIVNAKRNGYKSQWDSRDDQRSIRLGVFHAETNRYRKYKQ